MPVYGGYHPHFVPGLLDLVRRPPCHLQIAPLVGDSLVSRARNRIAAKFLASRCTHLLFLDTDLIFSPEHIARLIAHDLPFVCGLYPKKQPGLAWVCNTRAEYPPRDPVTGLQRILYGGTGCMLIAREVLEAIIANGPDLAYDPDDGEPTEPLYDFFRVGVYHDPADDRRRYLSEDWFFCQLALNSGIPLYADTCVVLKHCGEAIYPLEELSAASCELQAEECASATSNAQPATRAIAPATLNSAKQ
jgi:hypothetical protein